jgi:hypothetical protein
MKRRKLTYEEYLKNNWTKAPFLSEGLSVQPSVERTQLQKYVIEVDGYAKIYTSYLYVKVGR